MKRVRSFLSKHQAKLNNIGILLLFVVPHVAFILKYGIGVWEQVWHAGPALVSLVGLCGLTARLVRWKWPTPGLRLILLSWTETGVAVASSLILLQHLQLSRGLFAVVFGVTIFGIDWIVGLALNRLNSQKKRMQ
jgi:hypothetical protein